MDTTANHLLDQLAALDPEQRAELRGALAADLNARGEVADVLIAASSTDGAQKLASMARRQGRPQASPEAASVSRRPTALVAAAGLYSAKEGEPIPDRYALATAMSATLQRLDRKGPARGRTLVASAVYDYPEDRQLTEDAEHDARILDAICHPMALAATGGICLPVNVDYAVPTWATAERPIRDALPGFQATRGGLRFVIPPDISTWEAATTVWTQATDAAPGAETKAVVSLSCGTEELVYVNAIATRLGFGNMQSRFAPEQVAANTDVAIAAAARVAENELLELIFAASVKGVTQGTASQLGTVRELLTGLDMVLAQQKQLHRLPSSQMFTAIFPRWLRQELKIDLAREAAHQQGSEWNSLAITEAEIDSLFLRRNVKPVWHLDNGPSTESVSQVIASPVKGAIKAFPTKVSYYIFPEGAIQFLDAGRLDLGVVRDSTLDATNDYETFVEVFEGIAKRGYANAALQVVSAVESTGAAALGVDMKGKPPA
jgi:hypothetical protein